MAGAAEDQPRGQPADAAPDHHHLGLQRLLLLPNLATPVANVAVAWPLMPAAPSPTRRRPSRWAGVAPEDRRAQRRELLMATTFELLGTEGWSATTVRGVCQAARLNPRYFYESFRD